MHGEPGTSRTLESGAPLFADVIVPRHFAGPFTYLVPAQLRSVLRVGHLVLVPFGRSLVQGAVIAVTPHPPSALPVERLKAIRTLVTTGGAADISPWLLLLAKSVAEHYVAPWGQCLRLVLPPKRSTVDRSRILLTKEGERALASNESMSPAAVQLLKRLKRRPLGILLGRLSGEKYAGQENILSSILDRGWAHKVLGGAPRRSERLEESLPFPVSDFFASQTHHMREAPHIPTHLHELQAALIRALEERRAARLMVQAVWKDRFAMLRSAVARTVQLGLRSLVVTGESARAELLAAALEDPRWVTTVLHSLMPEQKRADIWNRICSKQVSVVVGTRAAVFLPLEPIGLIWIDREEDPALKEPMEPRYHAREVAWLRAQAAQALLVLGSTHLTLEALGVERQEHVLKAGDEPDGQPHIEVVDLREEDRRMLVSTRLLEAMRDAIARQAGVLLFLNRKAYAGALVCRDCGQIPRCPSCAVAFAFSRQKQQLFCHYCGGMHSTPDVCAACGGARMQPVGEGTERLEEEVKRRFPSARVLRVDGETLRSPKEAIAIWNRVRRREWDVLVGTQVLLRDDAWASVGLAGAVQADAGLSLPDFRAAERTFHLLKDAAALVQPRTTGGRLIIQSYLPSHHVIQAVARQDEAIFSSEELLHRTTLGFPPAVRLIVLHISGGQESVVERAATAWAAGLSRAVKGGLAGDHMTILGPVRSPVPRVRGRYRRQILIKSHPDFYAMPAIRSTLAELESSFARRTVKFDVDVDPIDMW
jgi:primosomal protein N' (replication factor Y) (superfamily II helicase)